MDSSPSLPAVTRDGLLVLGADRALGRMLSHAAAQAGLPLILVGQKGDELAALRAGLRLTLRKKMVEWTTASMSLTHDIERIAKLIEGTMPGAAIAVVPQGRRDDQGLVMEARLWLALQEDVIGVIALLRRLLSARQSDTPLVLLLATADWGDEAIEGASVGAWSSLVLELETWKGLVVALGRADGRLVASGALTPEIEKTWATFQGNVARQTKDEEDRRARDGRRIL